MEIKYYATVPIDDTIPLTIEGLLQLCDSFPEQAKKVNGGRGGPIKMEVASLECISKDRETYYQTMAMEDQQKVLLEQMSDISTCKQQLADMMISIPPVLNDTESARLL
ncbi:uncharacterized protein CEXT_349431 [Caerostris extrusa]|uniref:Uncharacterized protein n=1 Tax=Caerostris extrusa TaxID=172846 RepID=A0AAV4X753_CAEEX|nr:uncharacterized protein CEXT_349431 [Caerostris extrusa]